MNIRVLGLALLSLFFFTMTQELPDHDIYSGLELEPQVEPDMERKSQEVIRLTQNAVRHFLKNSIEVASNDFVHSPIWRKGELFVMVFDAKGRVLAHGDDNHLLWSTIADLKSIGGKPLIEEMIAIRGGKGRISYTWNNMLKSAYIEKVTKNGETYIIGSGFFPEGDEFTTKQLVKSATNHLVTNGSEATFALINTTKGPFVRGDVYLAAYDFNGVTLAHGQNQALIGQNRIDEVDSRGKPLIREIIEIARTKGSGWVEYYWQNEFKRAFVQKVTDPKTKKQYVITGGYYPYVTLKSIESYVKRAIAYLKSQGSRDAFSEFTNTAGEFSRGGLGIFVLDFNGKALASGENPSFVGQNLLKVTDQQGKPYIKEMIEMARNQRRGIISFFDYNTQGIAYFERVDLVDGKFIVGAYYFPDSKVQSTQTLVNQALSRIKANSAFSAFGDFTDPQGEFIRGDLSIFVYDTKGTRIVNGLQKNQIWQNFMRSVDQTGKSVVGEMIQTAINGGGWVEYKTRNAHRRIYVKAVEKELVSGEPKTFVIGSGYFL